MVMTVDRKSLPRVAIGAAVLEGRSELEQTNEVLIVVLILEKGVKETHEYQGLSVAVE